jgi:aldose 1-epimerase
MEGRGVHRDRGSARIITIADGPIELELLPEVGARVHRLRVFGHDLVRTPDDPSGHVRDPFRWGAYVMAPWCNRIAAVPTTVEGQLVSLAANFEDGKAIHGQVHSARWQPGPDGTLSVQGGGDGWPWPYECRLRVATVDAVLTLELSLTNLGLTPMPGGLGLHPWFRRPLDVRVNARTVIRSNLDPSAAAVPVSGSWDLRNVRPMPGDLDAAWLTAGDPAVELRWPDAGVQAFMRLRSGASAWIVAASPSSIDAVAIEPQTHAPYGLRRFLNGEQGALHPLEPGGMLELGIELAFERRKVQPLASCPRKLSPA